MVNNQLILFHSEQNGIPYIASGNELGEIAIWNLEKKKLHQIIQKAHDSEVVQLHFILSKPLLLTQGKDNKLKEWIFDVNDGNCRIFKERSGHFKPPSHCMFFDSTWLLTAGTDQMLRLNHVYRDQQNREYSQGRIQSIAKKSLRTEESLKLNPIIQFQTNNRRTRKWSDIISIHIKDSVARCWNTDSKTLSNIRFRAKNENDYNTSIALSMCGNMTFIGRKSGDIEAFNLESGLSRFLIKKAHVGPIRGIECNILNSKIYTTSSDGWLKIWNLEAQYSKTFKTNPLHSLNLGSPISSCILHKETDLLCIATDQFELRIFDMEQQKEVRRFMKNSQIKQVIFSPNGRWILSATTNKNIYVFDVLTSKIIDWFYFSDCVTSLAFSSDGALLATTHKNRLGVNIWVNKVYISNVFIEKDLSKPFFIETNSIRSEEKINGESNEEKKNCFNLMFLPTNIEKLQLNQNLISLSSLPKITRRNLINWDFILKSTKPNSKEKNNIPFFFPNVGISTTLEWNTKILKQKRKLDKFSTVSKLIRLIREGSDSEALKHLVNLTPIKGDTEIRSIGLNFEYEIEELHYVMQFFERQLFKKQNFDILQAYLHLFLKIHHDKISQHDVLLLTAKTLVDQIQLIWKNLEALFQSNLCIINYVLNLE